MRWNFWLMSAAGGHSKDSTTYDPRDQSIRELLLLPPQLVECQIKLRGLIEHPGANASTH